MEENNIIDIWDLFVEFIPEKHREIAANQYVNYLLTDEVEIETLQGITGNDDYLDNAIEEAAEKLAEHDDEDPYDDEDY